MNVKNLLLILAGAYLFNGCHSNNKPANSTVSEHAADSAKMNAIISQPIDTSIKNGPVIRRYANGIIKERSYYIAGKRQGECQSFYPNGKLWSDDYFTAGLIDGATTSYYDNGQKRYEGTCSKGKPTGIWKYYDNTGKLIHTVDYNKKHNNPVM